MVEIIQIDTCHSIVTQVFHNGYFGHIRHLIVFIPEFQRDKRLKTSSTILQLTQSIHMVYTMPKLFDMSIKHSSIRMHTQFMRLLVDIQPLFGRTFIMGDFLPDVGMEYLSPSSRHGVQPTCLKISQPFVMA